MATVPRPRISRPRLPTNALIGPTPSPKFAPFKELGTAGVAIFGGRPMSREKDVAVSYTQRWITYADIATNISIVAASLRYFLNVVSSAEWMVSPKDDKNKEAQQVAEFIDSVINSMYTPWRRVMRRCSMYRFNGFGIQEWTAKRRDEDGKIGLDDIEARPTHTIDRWEVDEKGTVTGVWQLSPQTSQYIWLPRGKLLYLVEDSLTDAPDGLGLFRHLVDPYKRLQKYLTLEGWGFERDLRGIPIGRIPYRAIAGWVEQGVMTKEDANNIIASIENFVKIQSKQEDTSITMDSAPYIVETEGGKSISGVMQYGIELLQGSAPDFNGIANAIMRVNQEMARIIGTEHLLLGGEGSANRALSEDKSRNFYLTVNGTLDEIVDAANKDIIIPICDLNGIAEELRPEFKHSDVSFRTVQEITAALRDLATAGAVLSPQDEAINEVREMLGISPASPMDAAMLGLLSGPPQNVNTQNPAAAAQPPNGKPRPPGGKVSEEEATLATVSRQPTPPLGKARSRRNRENGHANSAK